MWEAYELGNKDLLWSCIAFNGGIGGQQQAPCGAVTTGAVCLGLRHRCSPKDKQKAKQARLDARQDANELVRSFAERFGTITCFDLVGIDFSKPGGYQQFLESGTWKDKCDSYVQFVIEKLYELDERRKVVTVPQKVVIYTKPGCSTALPPSRTSRSAACPTRKSAPKITPRPSKRSCAYLTARASCPYWSAEKMSR